MTDASFISDRGNVFEQLFTESGLTCQQVIPQAFGSPFCQPCKLLIVPSGFADKKYYKVLPSLEKSGDKVKKFIEEGGVVLAFGAMLDDYIYDWLPMRLRYTMRFKEVNVNLVDTSTPASVFIEPGKLDCDGYFTEHDGKVVMTMDDGKPVLIYKQVGKGHIVASSLHQFPSKKFLEWACGKGREARQV